MAKEQMRWGILATGNIARTFARGLQRSKTGRLVAVASRDAVRAQAFADEHGSGDARGFGSAEELLASPDVDAVYIASPHHVHKDQTILAARAGKAILCEKPFCLNLDEAEEALAAVDEAGVFFMEAFMYRLSAQSARIRELVRSGVIGEIQQINAEFGFNAKRDWDNFRTDGAAGGGGLMDVGVYPVSFAGMVFGEEPTAATYVKGMDQQGYDGAGAGLLAYPGGKTLHFGTGIHLGLKNDARIYGTDGWIEVESPWFCAPESAVVVHAPGKEPVRYQEGTAGDDLYAAEADAVAENFERGECPVMTKADTLRQARAIDLLKRSAGMRFAPDLPNIAS